MTAGRPTVYNEELLEKAREYLTLCKDIEEDKENKIKASVKLPTKGGLAVHLDVSRETLYAWSKEHKAFSDIMERLGAIQEDRLLNKGLSGDYSPIIAKVLLTKHGYREGIDNTTNDKDLPTPIANIKRDDIETK